MTLTQQEAPAPAPERPRRWRPGSVEVLAVLLVLVVLLRGPITRSLAAPALQTWLTVFVSVLTQAIPFLVFGAFVLGVATALIAFGVSRLAGSERQMSVPLERKLRRLS